VLRFAIAIAFAFASGAALAGSMPKLPDDLPPLPTDYLRIGTWSGPYAGLLSGVVVDDAPSPALAAIAGYTFETDALVGVEAQAILAADGTVSVAGIGRLGIASNDLAVFGLAGAGMASEDGAFALLGGGVELALADAWRGRLQYEHAIDLSSHIETGIALVGLTRGF
jgi:hypothetical protein